MSSRRQVREAVVQFLYAIGGLQVPHPVTDSPALRLLLEPLEERKTRAQAKATVHLQQGRAKCIKGLEDIARRLVRIELHDDPATSIKPVRELLTAETSLRDTIESIQRELNGNKDAKRLRELLGTARELNKTSRTAAAALKNACPDFPALVAIREDTLAVADKLPLYAERLESAVTNTGNEIPELAATRKAQSDIDSFQSDIVGYIDGIGRNLATIDPLIESSVDNYVPDRIDRTDRAVLRLATYELTCLPDVPPAVVINEAIELARAFGTTDSPRFVNGILDRIRAQATKEA